MPTVLISDIRRLCDAALVAHGADVSIAAEMARAIAWAEARGNRICGLYYLESYCLQLRSGRVDGQAVPKISQPRASEIRVDAAHGFAQPAFAAALPRALTAVRETGVVSLALHHAHTCTALGYFVEQIAMGGALGLGLTNASPIVAAPGGKTRVIGTNPIAFAVPDGQGGVQMLFDMSTTTVALGRITMAKAAGESIPEGWALDSAGRPTTDPEAALQGSLTSAGGYKGWGFGLMAEILVACLGGGLFSRDVGALKAPEGAPHDLGQYFLLIDPGQGDFQDRLAMLANIVSQDAGARMPGQGKRPSPTAEVPEALWRQVEALAARSQR
jgi:(2R)-3-sulfolactate dehydrogenase (NADP+)